MEKKMQTTIEIKQQVERQNKESQILLDQLGKYIQNLKSSLPLNSIGESE